jgi:hypothetical protein
MKHQPSTLRRLSGSLICLWLIPTATWIGCGQGSNEKGHGQAQELPISGVQSHQDSANRASPNDAGTLRKLDNQVAPTVHLLHLDFEPYSHRIGDSLAELIIITIQKDLPIGALSAIIERRAHLALTSVISPIEDGKQANKIALRRAKAVRTFLLEHWRIFKIAYINSEQTITIQALQADSTKTTWGTGVPCSVDIHYVGHPRTTNE